jgi:nucleoid-associated protein YgaU
VFVRTLLVIGLAAVVWSAIPRPSGAHGERLVYRVKPYDTLWTIAAAHYGGDARDGVWRIQRANGLADSTLRTGQTLVLP